MSDTTTMIVQIGNSDDKLTQSEWSEYVGCVHDKIKEHAKEIHFNGGSSFDAIQQNACFVFEISKANYQYLCIDLKLLRECYRQESIAIIVGDTKFI